ncbi:hypothetical protein D9758_003973 [Tetrapyrgos nigripes]|uniref:DUF6699 domain-containing protein n=1 Tax=Tetrapyrgos nigripes TaxID=182062 RepID=A0A8H5LRV5_9AGAR|nr:hypothetical protein D9758_003973 [Tetrapyrgos nigripes]
MSQPYVYSPPPAYLASGYVNPHVSPQASPFIPSASLYGSPYSGNSPLPPPSPQLGPAIPFPAVPFPGTPNFDYQPVYTDGDVFRPRLPSWHGPPPSSPFFPPPSSALLTPDPNPYFPHHSRRRSFGGTTPTSPYLGLGVPEDDPWGPQIYGSPLTPSQFELHPWLNAQTFSGQLLLDLSAHDFNPLQVVSPPPMTQTVPVPYEYILMPATRPPINRLRIVCDLIPQWPMDVVYNPQNVNPASPGVIPIGSGGLGSPYGSPSVLGHQPHPPITVADILYTIHKSLHTRISQLDWAKLTLAEETAVAKVFTKRCKAVGSLEAVERERAEGVKRIDFLLGKVWFKGLVMDWNDGVMKLVVG